MLQTKPTFNPIVTNSDFQKAFQSRTIRLIAPASTCNLEIIEQLKTTTHLKIDVPDNLVEKNIIFHANSDENRFLQLKNAINDKSNSTIIWTLRGGYGSARLIDYLSQCPKPKTEKIFIGSSDITALHLFLSQQWGWRTIHGAGLASLLNPNQDPQNFERIATIVSKSKKTLTLDPIIPLYTAASKINIGTPWQIQTAGKILFLEEVGEKGYRIDRALNHLKQAGLLKDVHSIILGQFIASDASDNPDTPLIAETIRIAIERFATDTQIPVFKNDQFGHGPTNYPIVYNAKSDIIVNETPGEFSWVMHLERK